MTIDRNLADLMENGADAEMPVPDTAVPMISRSLRLPLDLDEHLHELAQARGIGTTTLMREILAAGVASIDNTAVVPLADVQRVIASLARPA
jgi:predicted DNA-binding protein